MWAFLEGNKYFSKMKMTFVLDTLSQDILGEWPSVKLNMSLFL